MHPQVNHSQRMSEKPLIPWVIAEESGKVIAGHCNCMAGLGECCSHVASLLWAVESGVRMRDSMTVTQKKAYWVIPNVVKKVPYAPVSKISFIGRKGSQTQLHSSTSNPPSPSQLKDMPDITDEEVSQLFASLAKCSSKPAILSLVEPYCSQYVPKSLDEGLPSSLSCLYTPELLNFNYGELLKHAKENTVSVSLDQIKTVEEKTRDQANSRLWFRMKSGRITASRFKSACCTKPEAPSFSLIMSVCHPETTKFKSTATHWGCKHEEVARAKYSSIMSQAHQDFSVSVCGFFINPQYPGISRWSYPVLLLW